MQRPDEETLRAILGLEGDPRGQLIFKWFKDSLTLATKGLSENTVFNAGRVAELFDALKNIDEARKNLEEILKGKEY